MPKLFDLHFQIDADNSGTAYKATTVLGNNGVSFSQIAATPSEALFMVAKDMEVAGMWGFILKNPAVSSFPFGGTTVTVKTQHQAPVDPKAPKKKPSELTSVPHPTCTALCTSYDLFGKGKCKNMCAHRAGL